jgi:hypothetical protein
MKATLYSQEDWEDRMIYPESLVLQQWHKRGGSEDMVLEKI